MKLRSIDNVDEVKDWIDKYIIDGFSGKEYKGKHVTLRIENPTIKSREYTIEDQKNAILSRRNLSRQVFADLKLIDNETRKVIDTRKKITLAMAPYHTGRNTVISNGSYYSPINQVRLRPGAYTRIKENGEVETHFNLISGSVSGMRINMEPHTGIFGVELKKHNIKLYPLLKYMGVDDDEMEKLWGKEIFNVNKNSSKNQLEILKIYPKINPYGDPNTSQEKKIEEIVEVLNKAKMDEDVTALTLGKPYKNLNKDAILNSTKRILNISKGSEYSDERDSLQFKKIYSIEDFYKEKIEKDAGNLGKNLVHKKLDKVRSLNKFVPGYFTRQLWGVIKSDPIVSPRGGMSQPIEEINPLDVYDQHHKITPMGEGGVNDLHIITLEARNVHPSQYGFVDYIRTPESQNIGIDLRLVMGAKKGDDNQIYAEFINAKTGKKEYLTPIQAIQKKLAFPGEMKKSLVEGFNKGKMSIMPKKEIEYYLENPNKQFSTYSNLIPMPQTVQGNRLFMAGKAIAMSLPLVYAEAPLVQVKNPKTGNSFEYELGRKILAKESKVDGVVNKIDKNNIYIKGKDGKLYRHGLYYHFPLNLKTLLDNKIRVHKGDNVKKGTLLASSNFTNKEGVLANGVNLKSAYIPYKGWNFEDGIIISESASKKLTSEQSYTFEYEIEKAGDQIISKSFFHNLFPTIYTNLNNIDSNGVVKQGTILKTGDPIILAARRKTISSKDIQLGNLHKSLKNRYSDDSSSWEHHSEGEVLNTFISDKYVKVLVRTHTPAQVGDKLTGRFGNKGVISRILDDDNMPYDEVTKEKMDILLNPIGIPSRINPAQNHEAMLGKIAKKTGKPYIMEHFGQNDITKYVSDELKKNKVDDSSTIVIPEDGNRKIKAFNGISYVWKLSKLSEGELKKREIAMYDINEQPIKGKGEEAQAIRIGSMEVNALLGHNAKNILREISTFKGSKNDDYWRAMKLGLPLPIVKVPFVYTKFLTMLEGAGINVKKTPNYTQLMPMTDKEILSRSSGQITKPDILYSKNMLPVKQGLFDPMITGGTIGSKWSHIKLNEPFPNPIMEDSIKKILGLTSIEFINLVKKGQLFEKLQSIDLDNEISSLRSVLKNSKGGKRNIAIKKLGILSNLKKMNLHPRDMMLKNIPVIPPIFRPVSVLGGLETLNPGNANLLYKDLITVNSILEANKKELPSDQLDVERENVYKTIKSVVGLGSSLNVKHKNKQIKGFIEEIVGEQPKTGFFQKRVLSKTQDLVGRAVATPDPTLGMDQISLPHNIAWKTYSPFILRRMIINGIQPTAAKKEILDRTERAKYYLLAEMRERPVLMNRNPSLHKYNIMAFFPILNNQDTIMTSPPIANGFNLDHDGDQINIHVPVTPEAVREAKQILLPSKNLFHIRDKKIHYTPVQGSIWGLYSLTKPSSGKPVTRFKTIGEMKQALRENKIGYNDPVKIG